jgi:hypothetical protein
MRQPKKNDSEEAKMKKKAFVALFLFTVTSSAMGDTPILQTSVNAWQGWSSQFAFAAPSDGKLLFTISNPDSSADGNFWFHDSPVQRYIKYQMLTGTCPYVYLAHPDQGTQGSVYEFDVPQSYGQLNYDVGYGPTGTENLGVDSISLAFRPGTLADEAKIFLGSLVSQPSQQNWAEWNLSVGQSGKLIFHTVSAGNNGGTHSLYVDGRGITESFIGSPACPTWWSVSLSPGDHVIRLTHEDDYRADNTGIRTTELWYNDVNVVPVPGAFLLGSIGLSYAGWRLRRRTT